MDKKLVFRKGKKEIATYKSAYEFADDYETLSKVFPENIIPRVQQSARQNAFGLCIIGSKMSFGQGYVLEMKKAA